MVSPAYYFDFFNDVFACATEQNCKNTPQCPPSCCVIAARITAAAAYQLHAAQSE